MRLAPTFVCVAVVAILAVTGWNLIAADNAAKGGDWPCYQGAGRDSRTTETIATLAADMKPAWKASLGAGYSSAIVVGGKVYAFGNVGNKDILRCINAADGNEVWTNDYDCGTAKDYPGPRSTPAFDSGLVYTLSREGHLRCVDANGALKWSKHMAKDFGGKAPGWGFACSPIILGDWVIVDVGVVYAFKKDTGEKVWASAEYPVGYSTPKPFELKGKKLLAVFNGFGLVLLDQADGKEVAKHPWKTNYNVNAASPVIFDDKVFISSGYNTGCALLQITDGGLELKWQNKNMCNHYATCVYEQGFIYGISGNAGGGKLTCLDAATGDVKWSKDGLGTGSLLRVGDKLLVQGEKGDLALVDMKSDAYKELGRAKVLSGTCWTQPVLVGGKVFCRNDKGDFVCLDVSGK